MRTRTGIFLLSLVMAGMIPAGSEADVKIFIDESRTQYVTTEELDCRTYERKAGITIGFKVGTFAFDVGPEVTLGKKESIQWDKSVHDLLAKYKELCGRYNAGAITMKEYSERVEKLDTLAREMAEFQEKMNQRVKAESKDAFRELETETRKEKVESPEVGKKLEGFSQQIGDLP